MTTVYDVAPVAGVPTATVSRVMHGSGVVSADTRQRLVEAVLRDTEYSLLLTLGGSGQQLDRRVRSLPRIIATAGCAS